MFKIVRESQTTLNKMVRENQTTQTTLNKMVIESQTTQTTLNQLVPLVVNASVESNNLWTHTQMKDSETDRNGNYRKVFLEYLGYSNQKRRKYPCMLTGQTGYGECVVVAHITPAKSKLRILKTIGMRKEDVKDPRNFLLLSKNVELCFDALQISFIKSNPLSTELTLKIWDKTVMSKPIWKDSKILIGHFDGEKLILGQHAPFRRGLSYQAYQAFLKFNYVDSIMPLEYGSDPNSEFSKNRRLLKDDLIRDIRTEVDSDDSDSEN
jgi:hypothetical protein